MIFWSLISVVFVCVFNSSDEVINHSAIGAKNGINCKEVDGPGWTINSLQNVTLDTWPWKCLNSRFNGSFLNETIFNASHSIFEAIKQGQIGFVQFFFEKAGVDLDEADKEGRSPLYWAILYRRFNISDYIFEKIELTNGATWDYVEAAAEQGHLDVIKYFLDERQINSPYRADYKPRVFTLAIESGNLALVKYLIEEKGFSVQDNDSQKYSHLILSAGESGNVELIKYLIYEKNISTTGVSHTGETALHKAAAADKVEAMRFFVDTLNYKVDEASDLQKTPLIAAIQAGSLNALKYLIEEKNVSLDILPFRDRPKDAISLALFFRQTAVVKYLIHFKEKTSKLEEKWWIEMLYEVVRAGNLDLVKYFIDERMINASTKNHLGQNLLHLAAMSENVDLMKYLINDKKMIDKINEVDEDHNTPALLSAAKGNLDILRFLLDDSHGDSTIINKRGENLLHVAASYEKPREEYFISLGPDDLEMMKYLVEEKNFDVNGKTYRGETAYDIAKEHYLSNSSVLKYLVEKMNQKSSKV